MKRFFVVVLLCVSIFGFAQNVEDIDGFDWVNFSNNDKIGYVVGFYSGLSTIWEWMFLEAGGAEAPPEVRERLKHYFYIELGIDELIIRIDDYYSSYDERQYKLNDTILWLIGKDYWNSSRFRQDDGIEDSAGET